MAPLSVSSPKRSILNRVKTCNFIKKRLQRRCFPVNIPKFSRTPILKKICEQLLLHRIWKRYCKYACKWLKKDLAAQVVAFKFFKTYINFSWNFRFVQYCYCCDLLKVCEIFSIQSCKPGCNITAEKNITCQSQHIIKDKAVLLNDIFPLICIRMNHKFILFT